MNIDINILRGIATILVMIGFTGICLWAYSSNRKEEFSKAALMPFLDDELDEKTDGEAEKTVSSLERGNHE